MTNRIDKKFRELKQARKKAFIAFITAGYPSLAVTERLVVTFAKSGVDIVELGVPFSDPMADGPVIQESSQAALSKGVNLGAIFRLVQRLRKKTNIPLCLMTYYNPIFAFGEGRFLKAASSAGIDGIIIPDCPPEEAGPFIKSANKYKLDVIYFISPTTCRKRAKFILSIARGFIYYVSLTGVTGQRKALPADLPAHLRAIKRLSDKPVCVGFGVSSPKQVRDIYKIADGVIVGSAIVNAIKKNLRQDNLVAKVKNFTAYLKNV